LIRQDKELWLKLLRSLLYRDLYLNAWEVFQEAIHILKNDGIQLWQIMELYLLNTDDEKVCFINIYYIIFGYLKTIHFWNYPGSLNIFY
jgi:hypothetical protein